MIKGRESFTFSDVRHTIANVIALKGFCVFMNEKCKREKNNFIITFLKLAAKSKMVKF
jgi:hypothetical protein